MESPQAPDRVIIQKGGAMKLNATFYAILTLVFTCFSADDTIHVPLPEEGRVFAYGDTVLVRWKTEEIIPTEDIVLQLYAGTEYEQSLSSTPYEESGAALWGVPSGLRPSRNYRIKVMRSSDRLVFGYSSTFGIEKNREITVSQPSANDTLMVGEPFTVRWNSTGTVGDRVRIEVLRDDIYHGTLTQSTSNDGEYSWVPNGDYNPRSTYRIRIWGILAEPVVGESAPFKFRNTLSLELLSPKEGDTLFLSQDATIGWRVQGYSSGVAIYLNSKGERIHTIADSASRGNTYRWTVDPEFPEGSDYTITIVEKHYPAVRAESGRFTLARPSIRVLRPLGDTTYTDTLNIAWDSYGIREPLAIGLYNGVELVHPLVRGVRPHGVYKWAIDTSKIQPGEYRIRISVLEAEEIAAFSEDFELDFRAHHTEGIPVPIPVKPDPTTNTKPVFRWHSVREASHYRLLVSDSVDFSHPLVAIPLADTTFRPSVELPLGRIYWKVKSDRNDAYSSVQSFTIAPKDIPLLVKFNGREVEIDRPVFRWHQVEGATEYRLEVYERSRMETVLAINVADTVFQPFVGLDPMLHHWRVGSDVDSKQYSAWDSLVIPRDNTAGSHGSPTVESGIQVSSNRGAAPVLHYATSRGGAVEIRLHDARGNLLAREHRIHGTSGQYRMQFPTTSGMYFCTVHMDGRIFRQKFVRAK